jgi:EAL domain-containing protein (putative c-di-GMP-specific phosphodiesterase class I)
MGDIGEDAAIGQPVVILSHGLGMGVIAEGGETAVHKAQLQILFSKPINSGAAALLAIQPQW